MTIEATLQEISSKLSTLITIAQTGKQFSAELVSTEAAEVEAPAAEVEAPAAEVEAPAAAKRGRRTKAQIEADNAAAAAAAAAAATPAAETQAADDVVDGDPAGTRYFVSEDHGVVVSVTPGEAAPQGNGFVQVPAALYLTKKAQFDKPLNTATTTPAPAATEPSATQEAATALAATSGVEPSWDDTVAVLVKVAKHEKLGNVTVKKIMSAIDPSAATVPALKPLNKNGQIVAMAEAALASVEVEDAALFG